MANSLDIFEIIRQNIVVLLLLISLVYIYTALDSRLKKLNESLQRVVTGILFGLIGIIAAIIVKRYFPVLIGDGRNLFILMSGIFYGPIAGFFTAVVVFVMNIATSNLVPSKFLMVPMIFGISYAMNRVLRKYQKQFMGYILWTLMIQVGGVNIICVLLVGPYTEMNRIFSYSYLISLILASVVLYIVGWMIFTEQEKQREKRELLETKEELAGQNMELTALYEEYTATEEELRNNYDKLQENSTELYRLVYYDTLIGIPNRAYLEEYLEEESHMKTSVITLFLIGVGNLKVINETLGHKYGDEAYVRICEMLKKEFPRHNLMKFAENKLVFIMDSKDKEYVNKQASRVVDCFAKPVQFSGYEVSVYVNIGIVRFPEDGSTAAELLMHADAALNVAVATGKNQISYFNEEIVLASIEKRDMQMSLMSALGNKELEVFYQPQYTILKDKISGFEALMRWKSPKHGYVSPVVFIACAEEIGIINELGEWILTEASKFARKINMGINSPIVISVNVSALQLVQRDFVGVVNRIMEETQCLPEWIGLEITESSLIASFDDCSLKLRNLKERGHKIALDDFGTGYSSLNYLRNLPLSTIKIDKSFIDPILEDLKHRKLTKSIIDISHQLSFRVIAEGVEDWEQQKLLNIYECDYVQGYLYGKPMTEDMAYKLIQEFALQSV